MFGREKEQDAVYLLNTEEVAKYFIENGYMETKYKLSATGATKDRLQKELNRYLENMEWIKGYSFLDQNYVIYHGKDRMSARQAFSKFRQIAEQTSNKKGIYSQANQQIENFMTEDEHNTICYLLRVGTDIIKVCVSKEQEENMKTVLKEINSFVYKQQKKRIFGRN